MPLPSLLDSNASEIEYYYASRLPDEPLKESRTFICTLWTPPTWRAPSVDFLMIQVRGVMIHVRGSKVWKGLFAAFPRATVLAHHLGLPAPPRPDLYRVAPPGRIP